MIGKALQMYAEDLGFTVNDDCAYGIYEGYLITLYDTIENALIQWFCLIVNHVKSPHSLTPWRDVKSFIYFSAGSFTISVSALARPAIP